MLPDASVFRTTTMASEDPLLDFELFAAAGGPAYHCPAPPSDLSTQGYPSRHRLESALDFATQNRQPTTMATTDASAYPLPNPSAVENKQPSPPRGEHQRSYQACDACRQRKVKCDLGSEFKNLP